MHDLLEGVIPITLHNLKQLINTNLININEINDNLKHIDFPKNSNIPHFFSQSILDKKNKQIKGTASEILEIFYSFPRLVNSINLNSNNHFNLYLLLRNIFDDVYSPVILKNTLVHLENMIRSFLDQFIILFGSH